MRRTRDHYPALAIGTLAALSGLTLANGRLLISGLLLAAAAALGAFIDLQRRRRR